MMASDHGATIGIMGGSGLYDMDTLKVVDQVVVDTPFGTPSAPLTKAQAGPHSVWFLPRHGVGHVLAPSEVPYAANIFALKKMGVTHILSISAVGGLVEEHAPGGVVLPDQFIDWSNGRINTFYGQGVVGHAGMADPTCDNWRNFVYQKATQLVPDTTNGGTYICIQGPQFSSRAESNLFRSWGGDIIGMTNATEAKLAREAAICYAALCFVTDYDCWKTDIESTSVEQIMAVLHANTERGRNILEEVLLDLGQLPECTLPNPEKAIVTAPGQRSIQRMKNLQELFGALQ